MGQKNLLLAGSGFWHGPGEKVAAFFGEGIMQNVSSLGLNERPQGNHQTVALFCVIRLKGELEQSRHSMGGRRAWKGSQSLLLTWNGDVVSVELGKYEVTGFIPWILPAFHGHQNLPSPGQPLGGNSTINESRAGGESEVGDG